jgi:hypothetical protein
LPTSGSRSSSAAADLQMRCVLDATETRIGLASRHPTLADLLQRVDAGPALPARISGNWPLHAERAGASVPRLLRCRLRLLHAQADLVHRQRLKIVQLSG